MSDCIRFFVNEVSAFNESDTSIRDVDVKKTITGDMYAEFETILQTPGRNYNNRTYDLQFLYNRSLTNPLLTSQRRRKGWYGEENHPKSNFTDVRVSGERMSEIDLSNTSHRIDDFRYEHGNIEGTLTTCTRNNAGDNMFGKITMGLIPAFSMRGFGYVDKSDKESLLKIDKLITYDWVFVPSHTDAFAKDKSIAYKTVKVPFKENTSIASMTDSSVFALLEDYKDEIKRDDDVKYFCEAMKIDVSNITPMNDGKCMFITDNGYIVAHASKRSYDRYNKLFKGGI